MAPSSFNRSRMGFKLFCCNHLKKPGTEIRQHSVFLCGSAFQR